MSRTSFVNWSERRNGDQPLFGTLQGHRILWWHHPMQSTARTNHEGSLEIAGTDTMLPNAVIAESLLFYGDKSIPDPLQ